MVFNARAAIAHGRKIELGFPADKMGNLPDTREIFSSHGGTKSLSGPDDIKEELMKNGPVVSASFEVPSVFEGEGSFTASDVGHTCDVMLVGWATKSYGECWVVAKILGSEENEVAFYHHGVDDDVIAPESSMEEFSWQSGP